MNNYLLSNIRFYFAQSVFMNNCHYKAYSRLGRRKELISKIVFSFSGITVILLILQIVGLEQKYQPLLHIVAFVGLILTGASLVFELINKEDLSILMYQQKNAAEKYKALRDKYMALLEEVMSNSTDEQTLRTKRDELLTAYSNIGEFAPVTDYADYAAAQKALGLAGNSDEEFTWSNDEINKFLPKELRI